MHPAGTCAAAARSACSTCSCSWRWLRRCGSWPRRRSSCGRSCSADSSGHRRASFRAPRKGDVYTWGGRQAYIEALYGARPFAYSGQLHRCSHVILPLWTWHCPWQVCLDPELPMIFSCAGAGGSGPAAGGAAGARGGALRGAAAHGRPRRPRRPHPADQPAHRARRCIWPTGYLDQPQAMQTAAMHKA